jgi:hypothetical protein
VKSEEVRLECNGQLIDLWTAAQTMPNSKIPRKLLVDGRAIRGAPQRMYLNCRGSRFTVRALKFERLKP